MNAYDELMTKYQEALKTITDLRAENEQLKTKLGIREDTHSGIESTADTTVFNKHSSADEKIRLFRRLFCGREDVFARRWFSKATGKSGYQPVCGNEWREDYCNKKIYKCSACPNRNLLPFPSAKGGSLHI